MDSIDDTIKKVIAEIVEISHQDVVSGARLVEDLGADSLDSVEFMIALENRYRIKIPDQEALKLKTVKQVIDYVKNKASDEKTIIE